MNNRLIWADSIKGWLILLVIIGHCIASIIGNDAANLDYWWCLIYSFHMPAFIAISGYLNYRGGENQINPIRVDVIIKRRFQQLIVPFLNWSIIMYAVKNNITSFYQCILQPTKSFWFLWALFFIVASFTILDYFSKKTKIKQETIMGVTCVGCAVTMIIFKDIRIFGIQYVLYYFIFYCLGFYINKYHLFTEKKLLIMLMVISWLLLASFWKPRELPSFIPLSGGIAIMFRFAYKFIVANVAIFAMFSIAPKVLNSHGKFNQLISKIGAVSLGLYTFHMTFVNQIVLFVKSYIENNVIVFFLSFLLLSILSYFIVTLLGKQKCAARLLLGKV